MGKPYLVPYDGGVTVQELAWGAAQRTTLRRVRRARGHNQAQCAKELAALGAPDVAAQSTVSNWESGKTHRPPDLTIAAIAIYCDFEAEPEPDNESRMQARSRSEEGSAQASQSEFAHLIAEMTGSPPLDDRQDRFIDQIAGRLGSGPPMSDADGEVVRVMFRLLGLDRP